MKTIDLESLKIKKWYISYNGMREPDYLTTYMYEFIDKSLIRLSLKELKNIIGDYCVKYEEHEGKPGAYFYINILFDINKIKKYDYFEVILLD
jgi:hypothetical protein